MVRPCGLRNVYTSYMLMAYSACFVCFLFVTRNTATIASTDATTAGPEGQYRLAFIGPC